MRVRVTIWLLTVTTAASLVVAPVCGEEYPSHDKGFLERLSAAAIDSSITTVVATQLAFDHRVDSSHIDVDTHNKTVHLTGHVENRSALFHAETIVKNNSHVVDVINDLAIKPND